MAAVAGAHHNPASLTTRDFALRKRTTGEIDNKQAGKYKQPEKSATTGVSSGDVGRWRLRWSDNGQHGLWDSIRRRQPGKKNGVGEKLKT